MGGTNTTCFGVCVALFRRSISDEGTRGDPSPHTVSFRVSFFRAVHILLFRRLPVQPGTLGDQEFKSPREPEIVGKVPRFRLSGPQHVESDADTHMAL